MNFAIVVFPGSNCDHDAYHAVKHVLGQEAHFVWHKDTSLGAADVVILPGGFAHGDYLRTGAIARFSPVMTAVQAFADSGGPVIGICNGFQVLVKTDLLPGPLAGRSGQTCTLTNNDCGRFVDRWVRLGARSKKCIWTDGIDQLEVPIAHGEGKFIAATDAVRQALWDNDQVAFVYVQSDGSPANGVFPDNPNGSVDDIAGVCDATGLVLGLMPHPERYVDAIQHYAWKSTAGTSQQGAGLRVFQNAVRHVRQAVAVGV